MDERGSNKKAVDRIRIWLKDHGYEGVFLGRRDNYAWVSGGAANHVVTNKEEGAAYYVICQDRIDVIADQSDLARIDAEQNPLHGRALVVPWYASMEDYIRKYMGGGQYVSDTGVAGTSNVQEAMVDLRLRLTEDELGRYREIGKLCADIVEGTCRDAKPGQTETEVAARLKCRCIEAGISPDCVLTGADERIMNYRHPVPSDKKIGKSLMVVLGGEKYGLNISMTRMVYFDEVPEMIQKRYEKTKYIFACMQLMMRDKMQYDEYFREVCRLYDEAGYDGEWKLHHQGGPTGYGCREFVVTPDNKKYIREGQAYAWNPTIQGTKCEETTFLSGGKIDTFTRSGGWPCDQVKTPYGTFEVAEILVKR